MSSGHQVHFSSFCWAKGCVCKLVMEKLVLLLLLNFNEALYIYVMYVTLEFAMKKVYVYTHL